MKGKTHNCVGKNQSDVCIKGKPHDCVEKNQSERSTYNHLLSREEIDGYLESPKPPMQSHISNA